MQELMVKAFGLRIAYDIINPEQTNTIFFIHGNSSSHHTWKHQFDSLLLSNYRLIAFDLPGHGLSDAAVEVTDSYSLPGIARLMSNAVLQLAKDNAYLMVGFSLGTNVISEMLAYQVQPSGIALVSSSTISSIDDMQKVFLPNPNAAILFQDEINHEIIDKLMRDSFFNHNVNGPGTYREDFMITKPPFRSLLIKSAMEGKVTDEMAALRRSGIPLLVVFGKHEKNVNPWHMDDADLFLWKDQIFKLQNASHFVHVDQPDIFNELLADYAADCFTITHF